MRENIEDAADENGVQEKKNVCLLKRKKFLQGKFNVAQGWGMVKRYEMRMFRMWLHGEVLAKWPEVVAGYQLSVISNR
ncbi:MAG TPA: hypothetical protein VNH19_02445 [Candidatus Limnocylindrales bacterium]|nr:hypothetical protein [Candidatus Limnocylindrales bacterium]